MKLWEPNVLIGVYPYSLRLANEEISRVCTVTGWCRKRLWPALSSTVLTHPLILPSSTVAASLFSPSAMFCPGNNFILSLSIDRSIRHSHPSLFILHTFLRLPRPPNIKLWEPNALFGEYPYALRLLNEIHRVCIPDESKVDNYRTQPIRILFRAYSALVGSHFDLFEEGEEDTVLEAPMEHLNKLLPALLYFHRTEISTGEGTVGTGDVFSSRNMHGRCIRILSRFPTPPSFDVVLQASFLLRLSIMQFSTIATYRCETKA
ncbi:hypothetical protein PRIPAC_78286 [Pristionchus pacificus]|uniref:Uncharacterized protein n=1 Tax=Pristionchus pacificus TaxID=54126 RepID=A0A2A6CB54_PRIPA|nr:hypothetical protein PRIPAC_78286 [Pristionchus pacificus]|eukprot:PDM75452.1 hypothetical protein PRIPAC_42629 [Pristionchus pacificus]